MMQFEGQRSGKKSIGSPRGSAALGLICVIVYGILLYHGMIHVSSNVHMFFVIRHSLKKP